MWMKCTESASIDKAVALALQMSNTKEFITARFLPKLDVLKVPYNVEVIHFATDCDSIGEVRPKQQSSNVQLTM